MLESGKDTSLHSLFGKERKGGEMDACIICGLTASDGDETEVSMESNKCMHWVHESCLPSHYSHAETDDIFLCPECAVYFYHHHR